MAYHNSNQQHPQRPQQHNASNQSHIQQPGAQQRSAQQTSPQMQPQETRGYTCLYPHPGGVRTFERYADLERHIRAVHNSDSAPRFDCQVATCHRRGQYGFSRNDKMIEHLREVHKLDIPKRVQGQQRRQALRDVYPSPPSSSESPGSDRGC